MRCFEETRGTTLSGMADRAAEFLAWIRAVGVDNQFQAWMRGELRDPPLGKLVRCNSARAQATWVGQVDHAAQGPSLGEDILGNLELVAQFAVLARVVVE